jgi:hypothetical protein
MLPQGSGFGGPSVLLDKFVYLLFVIAEFFAPIKDFMDKIMEKVVADTFPDSSHKPIDRNITTYFLSSFFSLPTKNNIKSSLCRTCPGLGPLGGGPQKLDTEI